jgi:hypothetical protein
MAKAAKTAAETTETTRAPINWGAIAPGIAFVVIVAIGVLAYFNMQAQEIKAREAAAKQLSQLGLPEGYPLRDIPVYPGLQVSEKETGETTSTDGKPMDKWIITASSSDDKKVIFDWYKERLLGRDMGQTQYISIPTGLAVTYGDEEYSVELEIEKLPSDKVTRVVQRVFRVREK